MTTPEASGEAQPKFPEAIVDAFREIEEYTETVEELLNVPAMPRQDGTYWVFGAFEVCGTGTFDQQGKPFIDIEYDPEERGKLLVDSTAWLAAYLTCGFAPAPTDLPTFDLSAEPYWRTKNNDSNL